jgi:large subunit ribosomal protein L30
MSTKQIKVTLKRSLAKRLPVHRQCVNGLGLTRVYQTVTVTATPEVLGMIRKVEFMLQVEEV